jgi:hypothetical protein
MKNKYLFDVEYPNSEEKQNSINCILEATYTEKNNMHKKITNLFVGPGLDIVFYRSKLLIVTSIFLYLFAGILGHISVGNIISSEYFVMLLFPIVNVSFFALSIWSEEQSEIIELKKTLKYSQTYIITLRMFYVSLIAIGINETMILAYVKNTNYVKMTVLAFASSFLFSLISLWLYDVFDNYYNIIFLCVAWIICGSILSKYVEAITNLLLNSIPIVAYILLAAASLLLFVYYLRKVEKNNAYA